VGTVRLRDDNTMLDTQVPSGTTATPGQAATRNQRRRRVVPFLLLAPSVLLLLVFTVYPVGSLLWLSVHENVLTSPLDHDFIGLSNFSAVLNSYYFRTSVTVTVIYTVMVLATLIPFGLGTALLLNTNTRVAGLLRGVILLPWAVPVIVSGIVWKYIFDGNFGVLNGLLFSLGLIPSYQSWLSDPFTARIAVLTAHIWKVGPFVSIMLLSSLQLIPPNLRDAIRIDGGGSWEHFRHVVFPFLRPTLMVVMVFETLVAVVLFDLIYVMTGGGPADATSLISWFAYAEIFKFLDLGKGAAMAFIIAAAVVLLSFIYVRVLSVGDAY
jgi:ABC-type sugar transport system permease subunit